MVLSCAMLEGSGVAGVGGGVGIWRKSLPKNKQASKHPQAFYGECLGKLESQDQFESCCTSMTYSRVAAMMEGSKSA